MKQVLLDHLIGPEPYFRDSGKKFKYCRLSRPPLLERMAGTTAVDEITWDREEWLKLRFDSESRRENKIERRLLPSSSTAGGQACGGCSNVTASGRWA
ncbi:hypothetical protein E3N88_17106 [Mikania micrantha]|uniref:Uncharacterized protein n=1 Tax=Mikania micrantha TaxID=192012 RepID=A0A5N6NSD9_9ASTR|nr:hypothetical protein E3N88_17106 [Mikania micrantha]